MDKQVDSVADYCSQLPEDRRDPFLKLRQCILENLPDGFEEQMSYGMIGYVVPHSLYPAGYQVDPKLPLPFLSIANQKSHIAFYHMGIYSFPELLEWFKGEYIQTTQRKPDMGKSCVRFKNLRNIPYNLIGDLVGKITVEEWIEKYQSTIKQSKK